MRFTTSDGVEIRYEVRGHGPPVLVCHGGPSNVCDTLIRSLGPLEDSCMLVYLDYRGSGASAAAPAETYTFDRLADDLDELRDHLGHGSVAVLAHSMGGFVALHHALRHPERCDRLALVGVTPCGVPWPMAVPTLQALGPVRTTRALLSAARFVAWWSWRPASRERTRAMYAPMAITQEARKELRAEVEASYPELPVDNDNASHLLEVMGRVDLRGALGSIGAPALVAYGSRDATMVAGGRMLAAGLPHAAVHVLPDVGHEPFIEVPEEIFPVLRDFLTG